MGIHKNHVPARMQWLRNSKSDFLALFLTALTRRSHIEVPRVDYEKLSGDRMGESSECIRTRVQAARNIQTKRYSNFEYSNIVLSAIIYLPRSLPHCAITSKITA